MTHACPIAVPNPDSASTTLAAIAHQSLALKIYMEDEVAMGTSEAQAGGDVGGVD